MIQIHITKACAHLCSPPEVLTAGMAKAVSVISIHAPLAGRDGKSDEFSPADLRK